MAGTPDLSTREPARVFFSCYNIFMSQYLTKDFLKFLLGFVSIIFISLIIVAALRAYQDKKNPENPSSQTAVPTQS